jgi:hypothetical protein
LTAALGVVPVVLFLALAAAPAALGHGGAARILVAPDPVRPGGTIEIRGEDLSADDTIRIVLVSSKGQADMATANADGVGHVVAWIQLPPDLTEGIYAVHAIDTSGGAVKAPLEVAGAPIIEEGDQGGPGEHDSLLVALPPGWQRSLSQPATTAAAPGGASSPRTATSSKPAESARVGPEVAMAVGVAAAFAVAIVVLGGLRRRRRLRSTPTD